MLAVLALSALGLPFVVGAMRGTSAGATGTPAPVTFVVSATSIVGSISPLIYGMNADDTPGSDFSSIVAETRPGLIRLGGDRWTAYNWENNASNAGSDYNFENDDYLSASKTPGAAVKPTVVAAKAAGAAAIVTIPIVDYVAADETGGDVFNTAGYLKKKFKMNRPTDPAKLTTKPVTTAPYVYQNQFVYWLKNTVPGADVLFSLDNEPDLWDSTHKEVHLLPVTYAEVMSRDLKYAKAIKKVWPTALVTGPVSYGWEGYETLQNAPDSAKDGNFLSWYLHQIHLADAKAGMTLVNDLDLHWYPEATGGGKRITGTATSPAAVAAREQAPRSLWDPTYVEHSWITADSLDGKAIELIPRIMGQISENNPGMALDFSEWNYGGGQSISGGIATADVLGIFGRYRVHASALWPLNANESYSYGAFAMYRNYNGHGAAFGDTEVKASTTIPTETSVYASIEHS
ncbi:MAG TPA: glycoside hydrolase family 44 protein, partial [Acidimicrobiales bacterium]|nr:glycoside hydrolase family 44 protein [Acidimicrobiales bacterium]